MTQNQNFWKFRSVPKFLYLEQEELLAFFKIENKNHSFEICRTCTKKVRDLKTTHDSIESCKEYFNRNGMDSICTTACADKYFTRLTYSGVTKTIHGNLQDFYEIKEKYPEAFKIIQTDDDQKMRFFNIFGRRAHGFICKNCFWIKIAKVQNSALKLPKCLQVCKNYKNLPEIEIVQLREILI